MRVDGGETRLGAIKRLSVELKGLVQPVRRLATVKSAAERRSSRLGAAAELAQIGGRSFMLAAQLIGNQEDEPATASLRDQLRALGETVLENVK